MKKGKGYDDKQAKNLPDLLSGDFLFTAIIIIAVSVMFNRGDFQKILRVMWPF